MSTQTSPQEALIYLMVVISAVDRDMSEAELRRIGEAVRFLPVFKGFDEKRIIEVAGECQKLLQAENGPDIVLNLVRDTVPLELHETAYALAVEVVAADFFAAPEEVRMLQIVRNRLQLDVAIAVAIEGAAKARYRELS
jgi:tellurite resistance protein